jgi:ketosteroid isomerase-like protein
MFYRAMGAGDMKHIAALLSPDLEWTGTESFPYYSGLWRAPHGESPNRGGISIP